MLGRLYLSKVQKAKIAVHILQALFMFVGLCVLIAMLTQGGHSDGRVYWYLALCLLSLPPLIYLIMTPMWERTVRFANAFVMAGIDILYTIFWFSAFIALAVFNNAGKDQGIKDKKLKGDGNCTTYAYGPAKKCELANAAVGLGVVVFLFWIATSGISIYFLLRWKKGKGLPWDGAQSKTYQEHDSIEVQTKDAWSSDVIEPDEHNSDDGRFTPRPVGYGDDESTLLHATDTENGRHPGTPWGPLSNSSSWRSDMPEENDYRNQHQYPASSTAGATAYNMHGGGYDSYQPGNPVLSETSRS